MLGMTIGWGQCLQLSNRLQMFEKGFRPVDVRIKLLFGLEFRRVHTAAAAAQFYGMLQVKHLVVDDIFDGVARNARVVEDAAHHDGVVGRIVMAEPVASVIAAPSHVRPSQQTIKEALVQIFEDIFQVISSALGTFDSFASTHLPQQMGFLGDVLRGDVPAIACGVCPIDGLAVHLSQQNVSNCPQHRVGRTFQQV